MHCHWSMSYWKSAPLWIISLERARLFSYELFCFSMHYAIRRRDFQRQLYKISGLQNVLYLGNFSIFLRVLRNVRCNDIFNLLTTLSCDKAEAGMLSSWNSRKKIKSIKFSMKTIQNSWEYFEYLLLLIGLFY